MRGENISGDSLEIQDISVFESAAKRMKESRRGVLVIGGSANPKDALMSAKVAKVLGWAVLADVTSGLRVGINGGNADLNVVKCCDYLLCSAEAAERFSPDCIVQLGSRIVSKRLCKFLDDAAAADDAGGGVAGRGRDGAIRLAYGHNRIRHGGRHPNLGQSSQERIGVPFFR